MLTERAVSRAVSRLPGTVDGNGPANSTRTEKVDPVAFKRERHTAAFGMAALLGTHLAADDHDAPTSLN